MRGAGLGTALIRGLQDEAAATSRRVSLHVEVHNPALVSPFLGAGASHASRPRLAYSRARFRPHRRKRFRVSGAGGGRWTARLLEISDLSAGQVGDDQAFGLVFRAQRRGPEQGSFTVRRHRFAQLPLFLVPTDASRRTYYAVVNRPS